MRDRLTREHLDDLAFPYLRRDNVTLLADQTVGEALASLRGTPLGERIVYFYVVDDQARLQGVVPTRRLLMSDTATRVRDLMSGSLVTLPTDVTIRDALRAFMESKFLAIPVVDAGGHLHGVLDVGLFEDEMAMLAQGRVADNVFQLIGVHLARPNTPVAGFRDRFPWLLANIAGGLLCAALASRWEPLLDAAVVLALFIPVVLALSESVSIQAVSLTLQALHAETPGGRFLGRAIGLELLTAAMLGTACGALVAGAAWAWQGDARVAAVILFAIVLAMITACVFGVALPTLMRLLRWDPRIAAGPIVLALGDVAALTFYFTIGARIL